MSSKTTKKTKQYEEIVAVINKLSDMPEATRKKLIADLTAKDVSKHKVIVSENTLLFSILRYYQICRDKERTVGVMERAIAWLEQDNFPAEEVCLLDLAVNGADDGSISSLVPRLVNTDIKRKAAKSAGFAQTELVEVFGEPEKRTYIRKTDTRKTDTRKTGNRKRTKDASFSNDDKNDDNDNDASPAKKHTVENSLEEDEDE